MRCRLTSQSDTSIVNREVKDNFIGFIAYQHQNSDNIPIYIDAWKLFLRIYSIELFLFNLSFRYNSLDHHKRISPILAACIFYRTHSVATDKEYQWFGKCASQMIAKSKLIIKQNVKWYNSSYVEKANSAEKHVQKFLDSVTILNRILFIHPPPCV